MLQVLENCLSTGTEQRLPHTWESIWSLYCSCAMCLLQILALLATDCVEGWREECILMSHLVLIVWQLFLFSLYLVASCCMLGRLSVWLSYGVYLSLYLIFFFSHATLVMLWIIISISLFIYLFILAEKWNEMAEVKYTFFLTDKWP